MPALAAGKTCSACGPFALDHAGGAGQLMQALPNARAVLHPRGAPHLIDPAKLIAGTRAVYGDELYSRLYGEILPIEPARILIAQDGQRFGLPGREFECVHTPGHALHHQAIVDREIRSGRLAAPKSESDYKALKPGTRYLHSDGNIKVKP